MGGFIRISPPDGRDVPWYGSWLLRFGCSPTAFGKNHARENWADFSVPICSQVRDIYLKAGKIRGVEKGLADRGGGGGARKSFPMPEIQASFLHPFPYASLRRRETQFWATIFAALGALSVANPLPPSPFRNLWEKGAATRWPQFLEMFLFRLLSPPLNMLYRELKNIYHHHPESK